MPMLDLSTDKWQEEALKSSGPSCLIIRAWMEPVAGTDRFQPAGFPEIGHVIYDSPRKDAATEKICIVDSSASMANHLETICLDGPAGELHPDLAGLPHVRCVTDQDDLPSEGDALDRLVCTTLTEGHRLASDYFLDGLVDRRWAEERQENKGKKGKEKLETIPAQWEGSRFRDKLRLEFGIKEVKKDKTYFIWPETWWTIYQTLFNHDPNSLVHGVMFAKEQIKLSRMLTGHLEAFGAARVGSSGVKFDRLGKTTSGQPIFAVDEETADSIVATFILDLALLRSYGRGEKDEKGQKGLTGRQKRLLLDLAVWKIKRLLQAPFRFRTGCHLMCSGINWYDETDGRVPMTAGFPEQSKKPDLRVNIKNSIAACKFIGDPVKVYYPSAELFKVGKDSETETAGGAGLPEPDADDSAEA